MGMANGAGHDQAHQREGLAFHPIAAADACAVPPAGEFLCPGCGRPLAIALRSDMCFAEAQVYCADCERDYQERRGQWASEGVTDSPLRAQRTQSEERD